MSRGGILLLSFWVFVVSTLGWCVDAPHASSRCISAKLNLTSSSGAEQKVEFAFPKASLTLAQTEKINNVLNDINRRVQGFLEIPPHLKIEISPSGKDFELELIDDRNSIIHAHYQFEEAGQSLSFEHTAPILAHEYGHYLLYWNLRGTPDSPWMKMAILRKQNPQLERILEKLKKRSADISARIKASGATTPEAREEWFRQYVNSERMEKLSAQQNRKLAELLYIKDMSEPYDELFADVLGVIAGRDGKAMARSYLEDPARGLGRDFTVPHSANPGETNSRFILNEVRHYIWVHYLSKPETMENPGALLKGLVTVLNDEARIVLSNKLLRLTNEQKNARLIAALQRYFQNAPTR